MINECTAAYGNHKGRRLLVKNRDKTYKPTFDFFHEILNGTEILYYVDRNVKHMEGMNEHGLGILYTTSNFQKDYADKNSNNIHIVMKALMSDTARDAVKVIKDFESGVHGLVFVSGDDGSFLVERNTNTGKTKVRRLRSKDSWDVVTNSPTMLTGGIDPSNGEDYISCQIRKAVAEAALYGIDNIADALEALAYKYFDEESHHNTLRSSDYETTCAQIGMDLNDKICYFTPVPKAYEKVNFKSMLPKKYKPKIKFVRRKFSEPSLAPFRLFTTRLDEQVVRFNLVNYLVDDGPERDLKGIDPKVKKKVDGVSRMELAKKAADQLWEKDRILVSLVRKLKQDPVFFTAGHTSAQVNKEIEVLEGMIEKIGEDYTQLLNIIHKERYGEPISIDGEPLDEDKKISLKRIQKLAGLNK